MRAIVIFAAILIGAGVAVSADEAKQPVDETKRLAEARTHLMLGGKPDALVEWPEGEPESKMRGSRLHRAAYEGRSYREAAPDIA